MNNLSFFFSNSLKWLDSHKPLSPPPPLQYWNFSEYLGVRNTCEWERWVNKYRRLTSMICMKLHNFTCKIHSEIYEIVRTFLFWNIPYICRCVKPFDIFQLSHKCEIPWKLDKYGVLKTYSKAVYLRFACRSHNIS